MLRFGAEIRRLSFPLVILTIDITLPSTHRELDNLLAFTVVVVVGVDDVVVIPLFICIIVAILLISELH